MFSLILCSLLTFQFILLFWPFLQGKCLSELFTAPRDWGCTSTFANLHLMLIIWLLWVPLVPETNGYFNHICLVHNFNCNSPSIWYLCLKSSSIWFLSQINYLVSILEWKLDILVFLVFSCAWLVKWHNCNLTNIDIVGITKKLFMFCHCRTSHSINCSSCFVSVL